MSINRPQVISALLIQVWRSVHEGRQSRGLYFRRLWSGLFYAHRYVDVYPFGQLAVAAITYAGSGLTVSFARRRLPSWLPFPVPVEHKQVDQMQTSGLTAHTQELIATSAPSDYRCAAACFFASSS